MDAAEPDGTGRKRIGGWAGRVLLLAILYVIAARVGLALSHAPDNVTLVWPPTGLALAALVLFGLRLWPGIQRCRLNPQQSAASARRECVLR